MIKIVINGIGGIPGERSFTFKHGINILSGYSSSGKTTIIKSLIAVLSYPSYYKNELERSAALRLGIVGEMKESPLVNVTRDNANIKFIIDKEIRELKIDKNGNIKYYGQGYENFILTSTFLNESPIVRNIIDGNADISWLIDELSYSNRFIEATETVDNIIFKIKMSLDEASSRMSSISRYINRIRELEKEKEKVKNEIIMLEKEIERHPPTDPTLEKERQKKLRRLEKIRALIDKLEEKKSEKNEEINILKSNLAKKQNELKKDMDEYEKLLNEVSELSKIINEVELDAIEEKIKLIERKLEIYRSVNNFLKLIYSKEKTSIKCPVCEVGEISHNAIENIIREYKNEREDLVEIILKKSKLEDHLDKIKRLKVKIDSNKKLCKDLEEKIDIINKEINEVNNKIKKLRDGEGLLEAEIERLEREMIKVGGERGKLYEKLGKKRRRLEELSEEIEKLNRDLGDLMYIDIFDVRTDVEKAVNVLRTWISRLEQIKDILLKHANEERTGVARIFNEKVKELLDRLGFKDFQDVWIDLENFTLNAFKVGGKRALQPNSLSTSERVTLAFLLQLATKEIYGMTNPFFLLDGLLLPFNPIKKEALLSYLSDLAEKSNMIIILTDVSDKELEIKYLGD